MSVSMVTSVSHASRERRTAVRKANSGSPTTPDDDDCADEEMEAEVVALDFDADFSRKVISFIRVVVERWRMSASVRFMWRISRARSWIADRAMMEEEEEQALFFLELEPVERRDVLRVGFKGFIEFSISIYI